MMWTGQGQEAGVKQVEGLEVHCTYVIKANYHISVT